MTYVRSMEKITEKKVGRRASQFIIDYSESFKEDDTFADIKLNCITFLMKKSHDFGNEKLYNDLSLVTKKINEMQKLRKAFKFKPCNTNTSYINRLIDNMLIEESVDCSFIEKTKILLEREINNFVDKLAFYYGILNIMLDCVEIDEENEENGSQTTD